MNEENQVEKPYVEDEDELREIARDGLTEQRLALSLGGVTVAILQEQRRMGFADQDVATVIAMDHDGEVDKKLYAVWLERLAKYRLAFFTEGGIDENDRFEGED